MRHEFRVFKCVHGLLGLLLKKQDPEILGQVTHSKTLWLSSGWGWNAALVLGRPGTNVSHARLVSWLGWAQLAFHCTSSVVWNKSWGLEILQPGVAFLAMVTSNILFRYIYGPHPGLFINARMWPYCPKWVTLILGHNTECDDFQSAGQQYWFSVFIQIGCFRHFSVQKHYF